MAHAPYIPSQTTAVREALVAMAGRYAALKAQYDQLRTEHAQFKAQLPQPEPLHMIAPPDTLGQAVERQRQHGQR